MAVKIFWILQHKNKYSIKAFSDESEIENHCSSKWCVFSTPSHLLACKFSDIVWNREDIYTDKLKNSKSVIHEKKIHSLPKCQIKI